MESNPFSKSIISEGANCNFLPMNQGFSNEYNQLPYQYQANQCINNPIHCNSSYSQQLTMTPFNTFSQSFQNSGYQGFSNYNNESSSNGNYNSFSSNQYLNSMSDSSNSLMPNQKFQSFDQNYTHPSFPQFSSLNFQQTFQKLNHLKKDPDFCLDPEEDSESEDEDEGNSDNQNIEEDFHSILCPIDLNVEDYLKFREQEMSKKN